MKPLLEKAGVKVFCVPGDHKLARQSYLDRYMVYKTELGGLASGWQQHALSDQTIYDETCQHLLAVRDGHVIGGYRLKISSNPSTLFVSDDEFDLRPIRERMAKGYVCCELSRAWLHVAARGMTTIAVLWRGLGEMIEAHDIRYFFGCASFVGITDPHIVAGELRYLYERHLAANELRLDAWGSPDTVVDLASLPVRESVLDVGGDGLPPLIRAYVQASAVIGAKAFIDKPSKTVDVGIVIDTQSIPKAYQRLVFGKKVV